MSLSNDITTFSSEGYSDAELGTQKMKLKTLTLYQYMRT